MIIIKRAALLLFLFLLMVANSMQIDIDLSHLPEVTAPKFYPLYKNRARHLHTYGGAGSSKSHFCAQKYIARILAGMKTGVKHSLVALRKTQPAVRAERYRFRGPHTFNCTMVLLNGGSVMRKKACAFPQQPRKTSVGAQAFCLCYTQTKVLCPWK